MTAELKHAAATPKAGTILVVDDTPDNLTVLSGVLREQGYDVRPVRSGRVALQAAKREAPDLVLLDVLMPEMDGYEVCRQFKADSLLKSIPIIFISAATDTDVKVRAFTSGGVDFISKPFAPAEVLARVHTHLALRSVERELERRLHEHEERYKSMFDSCKVPELLIDPVDGCIIDANRAAETYYGWPKARLTAMSVFDINTLSRDEVIAALDHVRAGRRSRLDFKHRLASGEVRDVEVYSGPVVVENRALLYSIIHDTGDRRRAEVALAQSRTLLDTISRMQARFIGDADVHAVFEAALADILTITGSQYGFLAELVEEPDGTRYQKTLAISGFPMEWAVERYGEAFTASDQRFLDFERLYATAVVSREPVIVNDLPGHPLSRGFPDGHPHFANFLGLPICRDNDVIGSIGLANRDDGYDVRVATFVQPAVAAVARILDAHRAQEQRRQAVLALGESESRYRNLVDTQIDMVVRFDVDGRITFVNNTVCTKLERPRSDLIGQSWTCLVDPEERSDMADCLEAACVYHGYSGVVETRFHGPSGARWYSWEIGAIGGTDGRLNEIQAIGRDITELRISQEALRVSEERLALAAAGAHIGVWDFDPTTKVTVWDDELRRLYGLGEAPPPDAAIWSTNLHPEDRERAGQDAATALASLDHLDTEFRIVRGDGEIRHVRAAGEVFRNGAGRPVRMVGINHDITERKQFERELAELLDLNQKIITESPVGMVVYRASGPCVLANRAYARILGVSLEDVQRGNFREIDVWKENGFLPMALRALESGRPQMGSAHHVAGDGREVWVDVHFLPFLRQGEPHLLCIKHDVSSWRQAEQALRDAKLDAERTSRAKSAFVANMSHEIRTPMNAILGLLYLLDQTGLTDIQHDYVDKTRLSAQSLLGILNDILDFSKVEADRLELELVPFRLDQLMSALATITSASAREKDIEVLFHIAPETPLALIGDPLRLQQVLTNLVSNAIKFTQAGEVVLSVVPGVIADDAVVLTFAVRDTGIGISAEQQQHIFEAFSQADSGTTRRYGGSGLGLAIAKRLVSLMGGDILLESVLGHGSTFRFTARFGRGPQEAVAAIPRAEGLPGTCPPFRLLVVDDNPTACMVLTTMVRSFGWQPVSAVSGREALAAIDRANVEHAPFDLIVLDWHLPEIGGQEVLSYVRASTQGSAIPALVVATAYDYERVLYEAGAHPAVHGVLVKPITASALLDSASKSCSALSTALAAPRHVPENTEPLAGLSLLVVEDNKINQMIACRILESAGAVVSVAGGGTEAVRILSGSPDRFDAVLMDIQMPDMDGYETTRSIREQLGLTGLPIIAMTANALPVDRERCLAAGMNDHIGKPLEIELLLNTIVHWARGPWAREPTEPEEPEPLLPELPELDLKTGLYRTGDDVVLLEQIMVDFVSRHTGAADVLSQALAADDYATLAQLSHDMRTLAANIGAMALSDAAAALQNAARHHDRVHLAPAVGEVINRLDVAMRSISIYLAGRS